MSRSGTKSGSVSSPKNAKRFRAYVLIQTLPGRLEGILRTLRRMAPVISSDSVTGPYDIVALVEVDEPRELSQVVAGAIGGLRGVTRTTTLLCTG
jgi:hypothetical protein